MERSDADETTNLRGYGAQHICLIVARSEGQVFKLVDKAKAGILAAYICKQDSDGGPDSDLTGVFGGFVDAGKQRNAHELRTS